LLGAVDSVVGWPAKAVEALAVRSQFDGFVFTDAEHEDITQILADNNFSSLYSQATVSELINSCAFFTLSAGTEGEPRVLISAWSALNAACIWDYRKKRVKAGIAIVSFDDGNKTPVEMNLYTDDAIVVIRKTDAGYSSERLPHIMRRPLIEPVVYRPSLDRPFGRSRISRAVISITDSAVRASLRTEVAAEFFTAPQKYLLGVDEDIFKDKSKGDAYIGAILALNRDEDGNVPEFGQLAQQSMQPHIDYMRSLAAQFAGETSIPISSLGVIHDNPASAEAIYAATQDLIIEAESLNATNGHSLRNIGLMTMAISQGISMDELGDAERSIMPKFRAVDKPSISAVSDAMLKQIQAVPWIGDTDVALERLQYTEDERARMKSDRRRASARGLLDELTKQREAQEATHAEPSTD